MTARNLIKAELEIERERIRSSFTTLLAHRGIIIDYVADSSPQCFDTFPAEALEVLFMKLGTKQLQEINIR
ncbi:hypothetical protein L2089_00970 [Paenibacillus hunanensis]|uniref:hypothetical protein n=1 Tax=Paenibacillus hunanensis TaxID=539262 RepID=UPI0020271E12|nr:hypothetical protein [Paenibacillus hunanensis]MCL9659240.1 hypothetical protein [Paenibacillus hunanensis]